MLKEIQQNTPTTRLEIVAVFAQLKGTKTSYRVETKYKVNGLFCLRPITGEPYKYLLLTAEQIRASFALHPQFALVTTC